MTHEILSQLVTEEIDAAIMRNQDSIIQSFADCADADTLIDPVIVQIVFQSMRISAQRAITIMLRTLERSGVLKLQADGEPILHLHKKDSD